MTVKEAHIIIQQELQTLNSFVGLDFDADEVDRALNTCLLNMVEDALSDLDTLRAESKFEDIQQRLDKLDRLYVVDKELTPTLNSSAPNPYYYYDLKTIQAPNKFYHLLQDRSKISVSCKIKGVPTTVTKVFPNILTKSFILDNSLSGTLTKTRKEAPVSNYYNGILRVFYDGFTISKIYIDYIKVPTLITHNSISKSSNTNSVTNTTKVTVLSTDDLIVGMTVTGTGIPNNTTIVSIDSNTQITISLAATVTGTNLLIYGANGSANMPLSESGNIELINKTVSYLLKVGEQSQQKIVNLENK